MSKFNRDKIIPRYTAIAIVITVLGIAVVIKALYIMTAKRSYWEEVAQRLRLENAEVKQKRGNILSCDGQLMAGTLPEYELVLDFQPGKQRDGKKDTAKINELNRLWDENIDSICNGLHKIFPARSAAEFKAHISKGRQKKLKDGSVGARYLKLWPRRVNYNTYLEVKKLPILCMNTNKGGFRGDQFISRRRPFGSLARRTIGDIGSETVKDKDGKIYKVDSARYGLELAYDSILRGKPGIKNRRKVLNKYLDIIVKEPENGADIVTTIDVGMQDLAERAVIDELKKINGQMGVAILMEVATGDVKAIVNMSKDADGVYREQLNHAISYICEPGSVFKVASFLVALDDGVVDTSYVIHTGSGVMPMYGRQMKDHNWRRGGYQDINVARTLEVSSNIGVSHVIDKFYHSNPEKYVGGLYRVGINENLKLPLAGYHPPKIRMPQKDKRGKYTDSWYKTTLAWMSIGYETQIAPINTIAFYNAIANDGKMMRPRFVKKVVKDGVTIKEFEPEVIKEQIAKPQTIKTMQTILEHVVSQGLGSKAGSKLFKVAGKTGTAQVSQGKAGYTSGTVQYWLSFAGYFPSDNPRYSCIVCLKKSGLPASGGGMSGVVFHNIAEGVMAKDVKMDVTSARDTTSVLVPDVKNGNVAAASYILNQLDVDSNKEWTEDFITNPVWGSAENTGKGVKFEVADTENHITPDVRGMGASDAVFLLESRGMKVQLSGRGKVRKQSCQPGKPVKEGQLCKLTLE